MTNTPPGPRWARPVLLAAALYNLAWGAFVVLAPGALFSLLGMDAPRYPGLWQCIGMIVGVYGVGYACAAIDPRRHWPIVLVGLLGKVLGPIGFVQAASTGQFPWRFGWTIVTNDLIWWLPFALLLRDAWRAFLAESPAVLPVAQALAEARTQDGRSLAALSRERPLLLVFLRHLGCTFCRETVADLARSRGDLERLGVLPVFLHQGDDEHAAAFLEAQGVGDLPRVSDPDRRAYRAFELRRGGFAALFGPRVWWRGFTAGVLAGHGIGGLDGDGFQLGGAFLVRDGRIVRAFRHRSAADRPDYPSLAAAAAGGAGDAA
jgi:hypothetical protein